jgi:3-dehydroquinate dehydratase/shikimate dehydrogenase
MEQSLLCETVTGSTMADLIAARDAATAGDMVELRLDGVDNLDVARALQGRRHPVVVTCRAAWEGGYFDGTEEERRAVLERALALGAEFVDVEWRALLAPHGAAGFANLIRRDPARIVVSSHDFAALPTDLQERVRAMRATGAAVIKVAVMAERLSDTLPLIDIGRSGNAVVIGMGEAGLPSRLLATRFGSKWTYAGNGVAPGQLPGCRMVDEFRFRAVGPRTRLFGVVSAHAMHSISPVMHNAAFAAAGIDAAYVPLRAADFADFLLFAEALGIEGASITIPYKLDALAAASRSDALTRSVGAANTLRRRDGEWEATNTDVGGFLEPLTAAFPSPLQGARASVLGGGGAARAVVVALGSRGAAVTVHTRRAEQARQVTQSLSAQPGPWPPARGSWDLLVNTTPLGGGALRRESPLPDGPFDGVLVYDLTYGQGESQLLEHARIAGCRTLDGLPMLIAQAERQFEWWTGVTPTPGVMRNAARRRLGLEQPAPPRATETQRQGVQR